MRLGILSSRTSWVHNGWGSWTRSLEGHIMNSLLWPSSFWMQSLGMQEAERRRHSWKFFNGRSRQAMSLYIAIPRLLIFTRAYLNYWTSGEKVHSTATLCRDLVDWPPWISTLWLIAHRQIYEQSTSSSFSRSLTVRSKWRLYSWSNTGMPFSVSLKGFHRITISWFDMFWRLSGPTSFPIRNSRELWKLDFSTN